MKPGERFEAIKQIADRLSSREDWAGIDLALESFDFPTSDMWDDRDERSYIIAMLKRGQDDQIAELVRYLTQEGSVDEGPWDDGYFRLFLTHLATKKVTAKELKAALRRYGLDVFVAHEDINPGKEWQYEIEKALRSCHALAALLHKGFRESDWCAQEVGFVLGRGLPVVPIKFDLNPYGFFGSVQALLGTGFEIKVLARKIVDVLLSDKRTSETLRNSFVEALVEARSFDQANTLAGLLSEDPAKVTLEQYKRLRKAQVENNQVGQAWDVVRSLGVIENALGPFARPAPVQSGYAYDEEPF